MITTRDRLTLALDGGAPDRTPLSIYSWMIDDVTSDAWPDKVFWANINLDLYYRPPEVLREAVKAKQRRAGMRGLAFEISEDLPANWRVSIPIVLDALNEP